MDSAATNGINRFFSQYPLKAYHKGQILIYARDDPAGIFFLESGKVRKYDIDSTGVEVVLNVFRPGVFFPVSWAINKTPNRYFFEAATSIEVRRAPVEDFVAYLKDHPETTYNLLQDSFSGIENAQQRVILLMSGSTHDRVLFELLIEGRRFGEMRGDGSCVITMGISDLAQRAGLSRETVSRELAKLMESEEVFSRVGRSFVVHDFQALEAKLSQS